MVFQFSCHAYEAGKHSEAKVYIDRGLDLIKDENDSKMKAFFSLAKAQISLKENKGLEALSYISVAKTRFTESGITGRLADCFYWETKVYLQNKDYEKATKTINEAIKIYKQNDLKSELKDCYAILSDIMVKQNNYDGALDNYKKYNEVYEDIYTNENLKSIADAEIKYETRIKELKIKTQQLQIKEEKPINI